MSACYAALIDPIALTDCAKEPEPKSYRKRSSLIVKILNKFWDLGLVLLIGWSGGVYELLCQH